MHAPVVLIHGTNAGPWTMANFRTHFETHGWQCHSPAYRHHDKPLSKESSTLLVGLSIADYVEDIAAAVATLEGPPILVGHSLGGVVAQKLAARGLARAIVLLNGSVNWGILPTTEQERALGKMFMSAGRFWETTLLPDFETMAKFGLNMLAPEEQRRVFNRLGPESGRVMFELFFWIFDENQTTKIDYDKVTCPVLMVSGTEDLAIPPSTSRVIAERHGRHASFYEAKSFGHYLTLEPNWRSVAELCAGWMADVY
jgi:non-heme chloroperoxidase